MKALIAGVGVIGQGWAIRFALFGWDVDLYDLEPLAAERTIALLERVRPQMAELYESLPNPGVVRQVSGLSGNYDWIQESLPEVLAIKQAFFAELSAVSAPVIAESSAKKACLMANTSGKLSCIQS